MDLFVFAKRTGKWKPAGRYGSAVLPGREASFFSLRFFFHSQKTRPPSVFLFFYCLFLFFFIIAAFDISFCCSLTTTLFCFLTKRSMKLTHGGGESEGRSKGGNQRGEREVVKYLFFFFY